MAKKAGYIRRFCVWGADKLPANASLLPLSRHSVVMFFDAEASRRLRRRGATRPPRRQPRDDVPGEKDDDDNSDGGERFSVGEAKDTRPLVGDGSRLENPAKRPRSAVGEGAQSPALASARLAGLTPPSPNTLWDGATDPGDLCRCGSTFSAVIRGTGSAPPLVSPVGGPSAAGQSTARAGGDLRVGGGARAVASRLPSHCHGRPQRARHGGQCVQSLLAAGHVPVLPQVVDRRVPVGWDIPRGDGNRRAAQARPPAPGDLCRVCQGPWEARAVGVARAAPLNCPGPAAATHDCRGISAPLR